MVVRNGLHGLLDQLVALILETLAVTVLAGVNTSTEVVVLRWWRGRSKFCVSGPSKEIDPKNESRSKEYLPVTISRDHIVDPKLLADLLDTQVQSVSFQLLASKVRHNHCRQAHQTGRLVLLLISPTVALLASLNAIFGRRFG